MKRVIEMFRNPATRPRALIWTAAGVIALLVLSAGGVIGTSTNWFCTVPCHNVHDDNTIAFNAGSHVSVSCVTCHEPVNGSPITFVLKKIEVLPDLIPTIANTFEIPVNPRSHLALEMGDEFCTQCHNLSTRTVSPSAGILIDHDKHTAKGVTCTSCHNRVAHPEEDVTLVLAKDQQKHENWMEMDACFRCHDLEPGAAAPGTCAACHPADFNLVPASHEATGWYTEFGESSGHATAYTEEASRVAEAETHAAEEAEIKHRAAPEMRPMGTVNTCYTCHQKQYCTDCHGLEMPHPQDFSKNHGDAGRKTPGTCAKCHARSAAEAKGDFCNACHHPQSTPGRPWVKQHDEAVKSTGATPCFNCHDQRYCSACHVRGPEAAAQFLREKAAGQ